MKISEDKLKEIQHEIENAYGEAVGIVDGGDPFKAITHYVAYMLLEYHMSGYESGIETARAMIRKAGLSSGKTC